MKEKGNKDPIAVALETVRRERKRKKHRRSEDRELDVVDQMRRNRKNGVGYWGEEEEDDASV